jgi:anthranilate phosphoribosyltransferase
MPQSADGSSVPQPPEFAQTDAPIDLRPALDALRTGDTLTADTMTAALTAMMQGTLHHSEIGAFLALLATRTPTGDEILGAARAMRAHVDAILTALDPASIVDTAGTGGAPKTFNVSTAAAIVAAAAGAHVAKHGNRSRTGRGSAEVLQHLGVNVDADRDTQIRCLETARICFAFAIHHHPATRHVMPVRKALKFPTIFNLLGPLTNPAGAQRQVVGVYAPQFMHPVAEALRDLGTRHALVVHSVDGLDEISISAPTDAIDVRDGQLRELRIDPVQLGVDLAPREAVVARDVRHAAELMQRIFNGDETGPPRAMLALNAAAAIYVAGLAADLHAALQCAESTIDDRSAAGTLEALIACSHQ